jgi:dTDP-4-dehydrorhamnose reductase
VTRYFVTGASGMLGTDVIRALSGREVTASTRSDLDITDSVAVRDAIAGHDVVINLAAFTGVDEAELKPAAAHAANADGVGLLASAASVAGARFLHVSTDYVFSGRGRTPHREDGTLDPVNEYGRSKAAGERRALAANRRTYILRTAWLYGVGGPNFARSIAERMRAGKELRVVDDQHGQPTWTVDVAQRIVSVLDDEIPFGIYHATNSGETTWYGFAKEIVARLGGEAEDVVPIKSSEIQRRAVRPAYSVLSHSAWAATPLPPMRGWREALSLAIADGTLDRP